MTIRIEFFGMQRSLTKTSSIDMPITEKTIVNDVLEYVREHYPDLPLDEKMILMIVNQEMTSQDTVLKSNDTVSFLPAIGGG